MRRYVTSLIICLILSRAEAAVIQTRLTAVPANTLISQTAGGGTELQTRNTFVDPTVYRRSATQTFVWNSDDDLDGVGFLMTSAQDPCWNAQPYQVSIQEIDASGTVLATNAYVTFNLDTNAVAASSWYYIDFDNVRMVNGKSYGLAFGPVYSSSYSSQRLRLETSITHDAYPDGVATQTGSAVAPFSSYTVTPVDTWHDLAFFLTSEDPAPVMEMISQTNLTVVPVNTVVSQTAVGGTELQVRNTFVNSTVYRRTASQTFVWNTDDDLDGIGFYLTGAQTTLWNPQPYQLSIQAIDAAGTVQSTAAYIEFNLNTNLGVASSWVYFDITDLDLVNGQAYGLAFGPVYSDSYSSQILRLSTSDSHEAYPEGVAVQLGSVAAPYTSYTVAPNDVWHDLTFLLTANHTGPAGPATIIELSSFSGDVMKMVVETPDSARLYHPKTTTDLVSGTWTNVPHSTNGLAPFIVADLSYSAVEGSNQVIYVNSTNTLAFFGVGE